MLKDKLTLEGRDFKSVAAPYFQYLFHRLTQRQFVAYIGGDKKVARKLINDLKYDGYVLKNCKLYAWAWWKFRQGAGPRPDYKAYEVLLEDAAFLRRLNLSHIKLDSVAYDLKTFNLKVNEMLNSSAMKTHIGKLISAKMLFLTKSYGVDRSELESDLKGEGIRSVYRQYPRFHSELHMLNTAKTTIHNTAMSKITYHTCPARQRLTRDAQGNFQAVHDTLDNVAHLEAPGQYMSHIRDHLRTIVDLSPKMRPETQGFLLALAGHKDHGFTEFLGQDNTHAAERMEYTKYMGRAAQFYGLSDKRVAHIFSLLRTHLQ